MSKRKLQRGQSLALRSPNCSLHTTTGDFELISIWNILFQVQLRNFLQHDCVQQTQINPNWADNCLHQRQVLLLTSFNQKHFRHVLLHHLPQVQNVEATRRPDRGEAEEKRFGLNNNNEEVSLTPSRLFTTKNKEEVIIKLQQRKSAWLPSFKYLSRHWSNDLHDV